MLHNLQFFLVQRSWIVSLDNLKWLRNSAVTYLASWWYLLTLAISCLWYGRIGRIVDAVMQCSTTKACCCRFCVSTIEKIALTSIFRVIPAMIKNKVMPMAAFWNHFSQMFTTGKFATVYYQYPFKVLLQINAANCCLWWLIATKGNPL